MHNKTHAILLCAGEGHCEVTKSKVLKKTWVDDVSLLFASINKISGDFFSLKRVCNLSVSDPLTHFKLKTFSFPIFNNILLLFYTWCH